MDVPLRLDVLVADALCVELKAQESLLPIHDTMLLSYMTVLQKPTGVIIDFQCQNIYKEGQKTLVNELYRTLPDV